MAKTAGNLFFLDQILRHRTEVPEQAAAVPSSVRHVVGERVARHGPSLHRLLRMCAVMGHEVDVELLADVAAVDRDTALDLLETATAGGLMMNPSPKRYVFAHALVTITLYEELSMSRRAEIHRRVAEALEHVRPNVPAAQLAHHWLGAQDDQRAIYACRDAGDQALALFSPTEAASWYQKARELTRDNAPLRCELQILLGAAQRQAGLGAYEATSSDAFAEACRLRRPDLMADAVLAAMRPEAASNIGRVDQAITALGKEPTPRRARLLSAVAVNLSYDPDTSRRNDAARTAVHTARRSGRDETLLAVLVAGVEALRAPDTLNERLTLSAEAVELSQRLADRAAEFWALCGHANALDEAGRRSEVDTLVERRLELAELLNQPTIHVAAGWAASKRAWLDGSLDEAERLALQMGRRAQLAGHPDATTNLGSSLWPVLRARGVWGGPKITVAFEKYGSGGPIARASSNRDDRARPPCCWPHGSGHRPRRRRPRWSFLVPLLPGVVRDHGHVVRGRRRGGRRGGSLDPAGCHRSVRRPLRHPQLGQRWLLSPSPRSPGRHARQPRRRRRAFRRRPPVSSRHPGAVSRVARTQLAWAHSLLRRAAPPVEQARGLGREAHATAIRHGFGQLRRDAQDLEASCAPA